jgi:hypothetical protein
MEKRKTFQLILYEAVNTLLYFDWMTGLILDLHRHWILAMISKIE